MKIKPAKRMAEQLSMIEDIKLSINDDYALNSEDCYHEERMLISWEELDKGVYLQQEICTGCGLLMRIKRGNINGDINK